MGELLSMDGYRRNRMAGPSTRARGGSRPSVEIAFDLGSVGTYLVAERVDRGMTGVTWRPVVADVLDSTPEDREALGARAAELRMPLVWPEPRPEPGRLAMRVAHFAAERGQAAPFVLAASRLAFCGGFDIDDPEILAEAAAASGLPLRECLRAAGDLTRDGTMEADARRLFAMGATELPVLRVGGRLFCGERRFVEAACAMRADGSPASGFGLDGYA